MYILVSTILLSTSLENFPSTYVPYGVHTCIIINMELRKFMFRYPHSLDKSSRRRPHRAVLSGCLNQPSQPAVSWPCAGLLLTADNAAGFGCIYFTDFHLENFCRWSRKKITWNSKLFWGCNYIFVCHTKYRGYVMTSFLGGGKFVVMGRQMSTTLHETMHMTCTCTCTCRRVYCTCAQTCSVLIDGWPLKFSFQIPNLIVIIGHCAWIHECVLGPDVLPCTPIP